MSQKVRVQTFLMVLLLGLSLFSLPLFSVWKKSAAAAMLKETARLQEKERMAKNVNLALRCQWFQNGRLAWLIFRVPGHSGYLKKQPQR